MYEFIEYVLWKLCNSFLLVLIACAGALAVLAIAYMHFRKKHGKEVKFPWGKALLYLMLVGYLAIVLYATLLRSSGGYWHVNLHLFRAWREAWNNYSAKNWANVLLNVAMFVPLGFLLPLIHKNFRKCYIMFPTGFGVSLAIELLQLVTARGIFDVDDLFANTLGVAIGFALVMTILSLLGEKGKRLKPSLIYGGATLALVLGICSIFVVYEWREYGNLPNAPAYTIDTSGVEWSLDCELPVVGEKLAAYQSQTRSLADCDAFAADFMERVGSDAYDITYYQEAAYYMDHGGENGYHFLFLSYYDSSYDYSCGFYNDAEWEDTDRETLEAALEAFPLLIPEYAEFTAEGEGWHSFTVQQHIDGAVMIDGTLRCRYADDGTVREIENDLLSYTYYEDVDVISPAEAYERLRDGKFSGMGFEYYAQETVSVQSCTLGYEIDTKGFYQPVYYFNVVSQDGSFDTQLMIPAMK